MTQEIVITEVWADGYRRLARDPVFGPWVKQVGAARLPVQNGGPFAYLTRAIVFQQLAGAAARTIHGRVIEALKGEVTPERVLRVRATTLKKAGLSAAKLASIRDLASKVRSGEVRLDDLHEQPDDEIVRRLTLVRGIGPWTAQMYLLFALHRPDVWPTGDLGVRSGFAKIHRLEAAPAPKALEQLGEPYRPWRSVAAFYCWRALETVLP
ncbi:MAG TPA: hypothetical protein VFQ22_10840 [Longimicrobiales bacterium]|nr:hypothetical protein [Longimicrobiales bacterium]